MRLGYHTITWGGVVGEATGVTSVKDLYYRATGSMEQAVADIAAAGYKGVEMFDGNVATYQHSPGSLQELLETSGVALVSVYTGANFIYEEILADEMDRVTRAADLAAQFGATHLVVGGGARRAAGTRDEDYDRLASALNKVDDIAGERALSACYHPHLTTIVESPGELDRLLPNTSIGFCPDTAHLLAGRGDPAALIRAYPDRVRHVHLKDVALNPVTFLPLGMGAVDFADVYAALTEIGYDGWLLVELDSYHGEPADAARISKAYLDALIDPARQLTS